MKLRHSILAAATGLCISLAGAPGLAQTTQSTTGSIAVIQPVLIVTKNTDLTFGTVIRPTSGSGTISIDANTGAVNTSNLSVVSGNTATRATFTVTGEASRNIQVTYPSTFNMTRTGGTEILAVSLTSTMGGGQIGGGGTVDFSMGGQVALSSTTPIGAYSGVYDVTVSYN